MRSVVGFVVLANAALVVAAEPERCEPRTGPNNGHALFMASKNRRTSAVEVYQCDFGYTLTGRAKHTCAGGRWTGDVPSCARIGGDAGRQNVVGSAQGWFPFRRMLRPDTTRKLRHSEKRPGKNNSPSSDAVDRTPLPPQTPVDSSIRFPMDMIRDSAKEYGVEDYDLSCLFRKRHGKHFLKAPKLPFANAVKYSKKKNVASPNNKYLEATYLCVKGYVFENPSENRLYCSDGRWIGVKPSCIAKTTPMTAYQMECYIKCPPDKNISLAVGAKSVEFEVERPKTNYDWTRFGTLSSGWNKNATRVLVPGLYVITYAVRDQEDGDIASCRTTVRVTDDEAPAVRDCPLYVQVMEDFSNNDTVPVSWPEPWFSDNVAVVQVTKTMEPGQLLGPGTYNVTYVATDASKNEITCNFIIDVKDGVTETPNV